jgi:hypothetical protein
MESVHVTDERKPRQGIASPNGPTIRSRPLSKLRLDDFKINPAANDGYDFAYSEVVRGRDDRAALQGCVLESCCGQSFRNLARTMREAAGPMAFQALLETHLGDDAWRLGTMTKADKEALWLEAKTRELANQHGRHRHRYARRPSPPGYWRTDMPSTQEELQHQKEAQQLEKEMIADRYREAMRPGGRYIFRDE